MLFLLSFFEKCLSLQTDNTKFQYHYPLIYMRFTKQKPVTWFDPGVLAKAAAKVVVSSLFGNFADRRESYSVWDAQYFDYSGERATMEKVPMQTETQIQDIQDLWSTIPAGDRGVDENGAVREDMPDIWFDYLSDTGDGFDATFTMASLVAKETILLEGKELKRGRLIVLGGDEVYPDPTREEYINRFAGPFEAAFPDNAPGGPADMYAIPGNHDWYDGLTNFIKLFCQKRKIGRWRTRQQFSYFAIRLPHNVWVWGIDVQLNSDIDEAQMRYFERIMQNSAFESGKVILCTAEPAWVRSSSQKVDSSYERLKLFEERCIKSTGKFKVAAVFTGDLHHFSHYDCEVEGEIVPRITAGGGGAFLHPTHNLPESGTLNYFTRENKQLVQKQEKIKLKAAFPEKPNSARLTYRNIFFNYFNYTFMALVMVVFAVMAWWMPVDKMNEGLPFGENVNTIFPPTVQLLMVLLLVGFTKFTDVLKSNKYYWWGFVHASVQVASFSLVAWKIGHNFPTDCCSPVIREILFALSVGVVSGFLSGFIMGIYLLISSLVFGIHDNEAFSSFKCSDYKNFLRVHVTATAITIYPIGVRNVVKDWKLDASDRENPKFTGSEIQAELIQKPIVVKL